MSAKESKRVTLEEVQRVKIMIEQCLLRYMTRKEVMDILYQYRKIEPSFTNIVWKRLEEENQEFFKAYYPRLVLCRQIKRFNHLLEKQAAVMDQLKHGDEVAMSNGTHMQQMHQVQHPVLTFNAGPSQHSGMQYTYNTSVDHSSNLLLDQNPNQVAYAPESHIPQMHQVQHPVPTFNAGPSQDSGMQYTYNTSAFDHSSNLLLDQSPNQVAYAPESHIPQMHQVQHPVPTFNAGPSQDSGMQYTYNTSAFDHSSNLLLDQNPNQVAYALESHIPQMHQVQHPVPRVLPQTGFNNSGPSAHSERPHAYPSNMLLAHTTNSGIPPVFDYPYNTMWVQNTDGGVLLGMHNGINPTDKIPTYFVPTNLLEPGCANCRLLMEHAYGDPFNTLLAQNPNVGMMRGMNNEMIPVNNNTTSLGNYGDQIGNSGVQFQASLHQLPIPSPPPFRNEPYSPGDEHSTNG